jgi:uncharacterized membrane protein ArfB
MDFVIQWLWYLLAFVAGSAVAWAVAAKFIKPAGAEESPEPPEVGTPR